MEYEIIDIDRKIADESIRPTGVVSVEDKLIWTGDCVINGLYTIDKLTFQVKNVLDSSQIFKFNKFNIISIFQWNDNVILVPSELNKKWVVYNKKTKKIEYKDVVKLDGETTGIYIIGKFGFLIPGSTREPIIIIDLDTLICFRKLEDWNKDIIKNHKKVFETRTGVIVNTSLFFQLYDTKYIIMANQNTANIYSVNIPYGICSIDYSNDRFWILPTGGSCIYATDKNGNVVEKVNLIWNKQWLLAADFIRIIALERYIFLMPISDENIYIYDKEDKQIIIINIAEDALKSMFPIKDSGSYWGYYVERNKLYFLPLKNKFLEIDLNTLKWTKKDIYLPSLISGRGLIYWFIWNHWYSQNIVKDESNKDLLRLYCEMIRSKDAVCKLYDKKNGKNIWRKLKS